MIPFTDKRPSEGIYSPAIAPCQHRNGVYLDHAESLCDEPTFFCVDCDSHVTTRDTGQNVQWTFTEELAFWFMVYTLLALIGWGLAIATR